MGIFPFGRLSTDRPPRLPADRADVFLLGVYPSALHVRWVRPDGVVQVQALAVDDEPEVFWDGADAAERVALWREQVGWQPGWGRVTPSGNGTSGRAVVDDVLQPLATTIDRCHVTDCLPRYLVKNGPGSQGKAMSSVYGPFAEARGLPEVSLPRRPSPAGLVRQAIGEERGRLMSQVTASGADRVVTLGQEAADVFAAVCDVGAVVLRPDEHYGCLRNVRLGARLLAWTPLKHPGLRSPKWQQRHAAWKASAVR